MKQTTGLIVVLLLSVGCGSARKGASLPPETVLAEMCQPGAGAQHVRGDVWMWVSSERDGNARFPANVDVRRAGELKLEITNLFGGPEATVRVTDQSIDVRKQGDAASSQLKSPEGYWNGIPVRWAKRLFLGQVPCPVGGARERPARHLDEDRLEVNVDGERYEYVWKVIEEKFTADTLTWQGRDGAGATFSFRDFEDGSRVARQWEAKSASGSVKIRWKDREAVR